MRRNIPSLDQQLDRLQHASPRFVARGLRWLRKPALIWVRIPVGLLLILGSFLSILPIFGLWMFPLGLVLIATDIPFLRKPVARLIAWGERKWTAWTGGNRAAGTNAGRCAP